MKEEREQQAGREQAEKRLAELGQWLRSVLGHCSDEESHSLKDAVRQHFEEPGTSQLRSLGERLRYVVTSLADDKSKAIKDALRAQFARETGMPVEEEHDQVEPQPAPIPERKPHVEES